MGSAGAALTGADVPAVARRVEDAAYGLRWLEIAYARRFDLEKSLAHDLPLAWLNGPSSATGVRHPLGRA